MSKVNTNQVGINPMVIGVLLIGLGGLLLLLNILNINYERFAWPFFIIGPGILIFVIALIVGESTGRALAIVGSIVTMTGIVLLYQNTTNHWTSWAYAWALVAPSSIGLGQLLYGSLRNQANTIKEARQLVVIGLIIFVIGFVFFELIIGISGFALGWFGCPLLLIGLGVLLLLYGYIFPRKKVTDDT